MQIKKECPGVMIRNKFQIMGDPNNQGHIEVGLQINNISSTDGPHTEVVRALDNQLIKLVYGSKDSQPISKKSEEGPSRNRPSAGGVRIRPRFLPLGPLKVELTGTYLIK